jgi:hypothetical protein
MTAPECDGTGKLPCTCWASVASSPIPCECPPCEGCPACRARREAEDAERRRQYEAELAYCQAKWGTAPPRAKAAKSGKAAAKDDQARLF